ncbi:MAG TPA: DEAD/DEAH box helicase [Sporichthya sp.]|nr:DEAD/DEAH box helicase [Sporichthya sp.]
MSQHAQYDRAPRRATSSRPTQNSSQKQYGRKPVSSNSRAPQRPAAAPVRSELELKLDAALAAPEPPTRTFAELGLPKAMVLALSRRDIHAPFAIQARALPDALAGRDVLGRAQTGSGKTLAFGLPMLTRLAATGQPARRSGGRTVAPPRGLVLVPTRELARQVADNLVAFGHTVDLSVAMVYGGAPISKQIAALRLGVDVVVATPGRLLDLIERRALTLSGIEITVLDEADHMADMGFLPDVRKILAMTPEGGQRLLFSATLDSAVARIVREYLPDPAVHAVATDDSQVQNMTHLVYGVKPVDKVDVTARIAARPARTLIFVRTKHGADRLVKQLGHAGVAAAAIHGNLNQNQRQRALAGFAGGSQRVLVATDVAARGIHVDDVDLVVHFDPPADEKAYLHRSGRTARAGNTGTVVALVEHAQRREMAAMHRKAGVDPVSHDVTPDHPEVVHLGNSGTPIPVVTLLPPVKSTSAQRSGRPARRPDSRPDNRPRQPRRSMRAAG